jgi:hypothetical protein
MKRSGKPKAEPKPRPQPYDPARAVDQALPEIVEALIAQARQGSYQHARFLFEFAGIAAFPQPGAQGEESLAALLFRELQLEES